MLSALLILPLLLLAVPVHAATLHATAIATGGFHRLVLRDDGTVTAGGFFGQDIDKGISPVHAAAMAAGGNPNPALHPKVRSPHGGIIHGASAIFPCTLSAIRYGFGTNRPLSPIRYIFVPPFPVSSVVREQRKDRIYLPQEKSRIICCASWP